MIVDQNERRTQAITKFLALKIKGESPKDIEKFCSDFSRLQTQAGDYCNVGFKRSVLERALQHNKHTMATHAAWKQSDNDNPDDLLRKIESLASKMSLGEPKAQAAGHVTAATDDGSLVEKQNGQGGNQGSHSREKQSVDAYSHVGGKA